MSELNLKALSHPFAEKEVFWRVGQAGKKKDGSPWAKVLAYIDARSVMQRLDDVVGPGNWRDRYWREGAESFMCGLSIKIDGEWVEKIDGAEETDVEGFKGGISKSLVRAGVKWGIGRYLYDLGESWAIIVENGDHYQAANTSKGTPAFSWNAPRLPEWALPKAEQVVPPVAHPPQPQSKMESKTRAANEALKGENGQKRIIAKGKQQAPGPTSRAKAVDEAVRDSAEPESDNDPGAFFSSGSFDAGEHDGGVPEFQRGGGTKAAPHGEAEGLNQGPDTQRSGSGNGSGAGQAGPNRANAGGSASLNPQRPGGSQELPNGMASGPGPAGGNSGGLSQERPLGSAEVVGIQKQQMAMDMMQALAACASKNELKNIWEGSVTSVAALPEFWRAKVIASKNEAKKRLGI